MRKQLALCAMISFLCVGTLQSQNKSNDAKESKIKWMTYKEAYELNKKGKKRKIITDVFTSWCGWCVRMDANTFSNPKIVEYINKNFWAVKFDAETKDTIVIEGVAYINQRPAANRSTHDLAQKLLQNQMSYPSYLFSNENNQAITIVPGYMDADNFLLVLRFIAEDVYLVKPFAQFKAENTATPK